MRHRSRKDEGEALTREEREALAREDGGAVDPIATMLAALDRKQSPDPAFTARVMQQVGERRVGLWRSALAFVLRPRQLRFTMIAAVPAAGIVGLAVAALSLPPAPPVEFVDRVQAPVTVAPPARSAALPAGSHKSVQLELPAPGARRVSVVGDFNEWMPDATAMRDEDGDGIWTVTLDLRSGRYAYMFLIDGEKWVVDPDAEAARPDGFGGQNSLLRL